VSAAVLLIALGLFMLLGSGAYGVASLREAERRAADLAFGLGLALSLPLLLASLLPTWIQWLILVAIAIALTAGAIAFLLPLGRVERGNDVPHQRYDERDVLFARARLESGSANYEAYYTMRPERKAGDDKTRSLPGLLSPEASEANPLLFGATDATFDLIGALHDAVDGPVAPTRTEPEARAMSAYVKGLARYWGAHSAGITELRPYHIYSHIGRGSGEYGAPIHLDHRYAIVFTVEMEHALVGTAPAAPTLLESARQYANSAQIAIQLGNLIRSLGHAARAHINGNYRVIAPLVARDAGLGEIGRMGLLMTPRLGPRVRLGVVTTDLPLLPDNRGEDSSVLDFCRVCVKCASNCPVRAIPFADRLEIEGALRWRIDGEICYRYWAVTGTDCARCMAVCPYAHPASPPHNLVRWAVQRSGAARRAVTWLDDLFYGRTPAPKRPPSWMLAKAAQGHRAEAAGAGADGPDIGQGELHGTQ
jgi:ferredoxin